MTQAPPTTQTSEPESPIQPWEWIAATIGLFIVIATIGILLWSAARPAVQATAPLVRQVSSFPGPGGTTTIEVLVENQCEETLIEVEIEGTLATPGNEPQVAGATVTFLPAKSHRTVFLVFKENPHVKAPITLRAISYQLP